MFKGIFKPKTRIEEDLKKIIVEQKHVINACHSKHDEYKKETDEVIDFIIEENISFRNRIIFLESEQNRKNLTIQCLGNENNKAYYEIDFLRKYVKKRGKSDKRNN